MRTRHHRLAATILFFLCGPLLAQDTPATRTLREVRQFPKLAYVFDVAFSPDGLRCISGAGLELKIYDVQSGEEVDRIEAGRNATVFVDCSPNARHVAFCGLTGRIQVWDANEGAVISSFQHAPMVFNVNFSPDGQTLATCGMDFLVRLWDPETGSERLALKGHEHGVIVSRFSPNGRQILTGSGDHTVRLWDAETGALLHTFQHSEWVWSVAFSPDGRWIATATGGHMREPLLDELYTPGADKKIRIWDTTSKGLVRELEGHTHIIRDIEFTPDGSLLVSASLDDTVRVWDLESGRSVGRLNAGMEMVQAMEVSPSGNYVLCGGRTAKEGSCLRLYELPGTPIRMADMSLAQMEHDGSNLRQLARAPGFAFHANPSFSPSGQMIAWHSTAPGTNDATVFVARADGRRLRKITSGKCPRWLDESMLLFERDPEGLFAIHSDGSNEKHLANGSCLSHDQQQMVIARGQHLELGKLDEAGTQPLVLDPPPHIASGMALSHDLRRIAYVAQSPGGGNGLYVAELASGTGQKLADQPVGGEFFPDWSPDDSKIVFTAGPNYIGPDQPANRVYCVEVASGKVEALTDESQDCRHAVWSPDGQHILLTRTQRN